MCSFVYACLTYIQPVTLFLQHWLYFWWIANQGCYYEGIWRIRCECITELNVGIVFYLCISNLSLTNNNNIIMTPLFSQQIQKIFKLLGTPTDTDWPEFPSLPSAGTFKWKNKDGSELGRTFLVNSFSATGQSYLDTTGFDLLGKLLTLNPRKRISAEDALNHSYFKDGVKMQVPEFFIWQCRLPKGHSWLHQTSRTMQVIFAKHIIK